MKPGKLQQVKIADQTERLPVTIAVLDLEPDELARRLQLSFESIDDDLGPTRAAVVQSGTGMRFALVRYLGNRSPGTEVLTQERDSSRAALEDVLTTLALDRSDVRWTRPDLSTPETSPRGAWQVWRQDDHGNRCLVKDAASAEEAQRLATALAAGGHKQFYSVAHAAEPADGDAFHSANDSVANEVV